jgi:hypothetical protein
MITFTWSSQKSLAAAANMSVSTTCCKREPRMQPGKNVRTMAAEPEQAVRIRVVGVPAPPSARPSVRPRVLGPGATGTADWQKAVIIRVGVGSAGVGDARRGVQAAAGPWEWGGEKGGAPRWPRQPASLENECVCRAVRRGHAISQDRQGNGFTRLL